MLRLIAFLMCLVVLAIGGGWVRAGMALGAIVFLLLCAHVLVWVLGVIKRG